MLYTHPTEDLVLSFAREAVQMGTRTGRQEDVINALQHVCSIPIEFPSKTSLQSAVLKLFPRPSVVQEQNLPNRISRFDMVNRLLASAPQGQSTTRPTIQILENEGEKQAIYSNVPGKSPTSPEDGSNNPLAECATPCIPLCLELEPGEERVLPRVSACVAKVPKACDKNIGPVLIQ
jgi:hypothetical protein